jgi:hypothetical protein
LCLEVERNDAGEEESIVYAVGKWRRWIVREMRGDKI